MLKMRLGARAQENGVDFAVWAPHAEAVHVVGAFNDWQPGDELTAAGDGFWQGHVVGAEIGQPYKYLIINGSHKLMRIDPYARMVADGNGIIHDPDPAWGETSYTPPPQNKVVIYELHVGTFNNDDPDDPGDLESVIERLDYLADLGVTHIELMPLSEFRGDISWGYNPAHLFAIESAYGGRDWFQKLVESAHARDLGVIVDVVYNHWGPDSLDLWQFDGWAEDEMGGIYFYNDERADTPWGDTRPDYGRPEVRQIIRDNVFFWLEEMQCDGLRWDATAYIRNVKGAEGGELPAGWSLMAEVNRAVKTNLNGKLLIAEDLQGNNAITLPADMGGAGFDAQWSGRFEPVLRRQLLALRDEDRSVGELAAAIQQRYNSVAFDRVIYSESHDSVAEGGARIPEELDQGETTDYFERKRALLGLAITLTAPGIPMVFMGQEFLQYGWFDDKSPLNWHHADLFAGITRATRDLIALRRDLHGVSAGLSHNACHISHINEQNKVLVMLRGDSPETAVAVIINLSGIALASYQIGLPFGGLWSIHFNSDAVVYDELFDNIGGTHISADDGPHDGFNQSGHINLGAYTLLIASPGR